MRAELRESELLETSTGHSYFLNFAYNPTIIERVKDLPVRKYNGKSREWEVPYTDREFLEQQFPNLRLSVLGDDETGYNMIINVPKFKFKTEPFKHQQEAFDYGMKKNKWLLGDDMGLGKTKVAIDIACALKSKSDKCIIICGVNTLKHNWVKEIGIHSDEKSIIVGGSLKNKLKILNSENDAYFYIINIESLRNVDIVEALNRLVEDGVANVAVVDEIHKAKNPTSKQGVGLSYIAPKYQLAMTGTPLQNSPLDAYMTLRWLGVEDHDFKQFKGFYCEFGQFNKIEGYRNMDHLNKKLNSVMLRRLKDDVLNLPPKTRMKEYIELGTKQQKLYNSIIEDLKIKIDNIDKVKISGNPLAMMIRLRQANSFTDILSSEINESAKMDRLEDMVEEVVSSGNKAIVFSGWTQVTERVYKRLSSKYKVAYIDGSVSEKERHIQEKLFQEDDDYKVIIGTTGAMGTGLTLTSANYVFFMDKPWTMSDTEQAEDRAYRIGTTKNVTIVTLIAEGTIDEKIEELLEMKKELFDLVVDGKGSVDDKKQLLRFLIGEEEEINGKSKDKERAVF